MKLGEQLKVIEASQKIILEAYTQDFENLPIGKILKTTIYNEKLDNFLNTEVMAISVGPKDSLLIKI